MNGELQIIPGEGGRGDEIQIDADGRHIIANDGQQLEVVTLVSPPASCNLTRVTL